MLSQIPIQSLEQIQATQEVYYTRHVENIEILCPGHKNSATILSMNIFKLFQTKKEKTRSRLLRLFLTGFAMGSADIVPGVSGGTIAFIFGIYEELVYSIKVATGGSVKLLLKGKIKEAITTIPWEFIIPLGGGLAVALLTLSKVISWLLTNQPIYIWSFFFGLVAASIYIIGQRVNRWSTQNIIGLIIGAIITFYIVGAVPVNTPDTLITMFFAGAIAITAMILPGVSGSFLLLLMGKYHHILDAVNNQDFIRIGIFMAGAVFGLALFARVLSYLFKTHHNLVVATMIGVMLGSLRKIWPWKEVLTTRINSHGEMVPLATANMLPQIDSSLLLAIFIALLAGTLIFFLETFNVTKEHTHDVDPEFESQHKKAKKT